MKVQLFFAIILVLILVPISFADSHNSQSQEELDKLVDKKKGENIKKDSKTGGVTVTKKPKKKGAGSVAVTVDDGAHFEREKDGDGTFTVTGRKKIKITIDENGKGADLNFRTDGPVETSLEKGKSYHPSPGEFLDVSIAADGTIKVTAMKITEIVNKKVVAELEGNLDGDGKPITKVITSERVAEYSKGFLTKYVDGKMSHTYVLSDTEKVVKSFVPCVDCIRELSETRAIELSSTKRVFLQLHRHSQFDKVRVLNVQDNEVAIDVTDHPQIHVFAQEPEGSGPIKIQQTIDDGTPNGNTIELTMRKGETKPGISGGTDFPDGLALSYQYRTVNQGKTKTQTFLRSAGEDKLLIAQDNKLVGQILSQHKDFVKQYSFLVRGIGRIGPPAVLGERGQFPLEKRHFIIDFARHLKYGLPGGLDVRAAEGTEMRPPTPGRVIWAKELPTQEVYDFHRPGLYGKTLVLEHLDEKGNKYWTSYSHLKTINAKVGQLVGVHDVVALTGKTGKTRRGSLKPHLHIEVRVQNRMDLGVIEGANEGMLAYRYATPVRVPRFFGWNQGGS